MDIFDQVLEQRGQQAQQDLLSQDKPLDIFDQVLAEQDPDAEPTAAPIPEVSLRGPAEIVTDFPQEGQQAQPMPEVSLPPIERRPLPAGFPPLETRTGGVEQLPVTPSPIAPPEEAAPYRPSYDYLGDMPGVTPPQGPPVVEPPYEAPPVHGAAWRHIQAGNLADAPWAIEPGTPETSPAMAALQNPIVSTIADIPRTAMIRGVQGVHALMSAAEGATLEGIPAAITGLAQVGLQSPGLPKGETPTADILDFVRTSPTFADVRGLHGEAQRAYAEIPQTLRDSLEAQAGKTIGGLAPLALADAALGPAGGVAVIMTQALGNNIDSRYDENLAKGMSRENAARDAVFTGVKAAGAQGLVWGRLSGPMKKLTDRVIIDKLVGKGLNRIAAGRIAQAAHGYPMGVVSQAAQNVATGRPITEGTHEAGKGMALVFGLTPRGYTAREVAARRISIPPGEARQAVSGAVRLPGGERRPGGRAELQKAKQRAMETSARAGHDIARSNYERVLTNTSSRKTNATRFRENVPKAFQSKDDVQQIRNGIIHMRDNLLKAARAALKEPWARPASKQYEGYNKYSHYLSDFFGGRWKPETVMVTESAESPNTSPDNSFEATRRLMKMLSTNTEDVFDDKMADWALNRTGKNSAGDTVHLYDPLHVNFLKGKKFSEVPAGLELQAKWLRAFDEVYHPDKTLRVVRPDGTLGDTVKTSTGAEMPFAWTPFKMIQNGVDALLEQRPVEEILHTPKVANYYMSKLLAFERSDHVVADTHHTSASWGNSLPAEHELISKVFKASRDVNNDEFAGYYSLVQEATIQAAKKMGMDPKEFQALVWSYQRGYKSPDVLGPGLAEVIQGLWKNAAQGNITGREAYDGTEQIAKDFHGGTVPAPDYYGGRFRSADAPPPGTSGQPAELPQGGGVPGSAGGGGRIPDAGGVAEDLRVARTFFSSNTGNLTLDQAQAALHSKEHAVARLIDHDVNSQLGLGGSSRSGIGVWGDGAEDSIMHLAAGAENFDQVRYAAAIKAQLSGQKSALAFLTDPAGGDAVRSFIVPGKDIARIHDDLMSAGIEHKTMLPEGGDTRIFVLDQGKELADKLGEIAQKYGITDGRTETGKGEFVGSGETFPESSKQFDAIRADYEDRFPLARHYEERPGDYYSGRDTSTRKTLSQRAARLQPKSEAGSVGGRGGEERPEEDYRIRHRPNIAGPPGHDLLEGDMAPRDIYENPRYYTGDPGSKGYRESVQALRVMRGNPERDITVYRAAPAKSLNHGDWVSLSKAYAEQHGMADTPAGDVPVHSFKVKAKDLRWDGNTLEEFGYFPTQDRPKIAGQPARPDQTMKSALHGEIDQALASPRNQFAKDVIRKGKYGDVKLRFMAEPHPNPELKDQIIYGVSALEDPQIGTNFDANINKNFATRDQFVNALSRYLKNEPAQAQSDAVSTLPPGEAGSLAERARRLQPPSESGAVGASGGEEAPLPEEQRPRAFGIQLQNDKRLLQELKDNLGNTDYTPIPNKITAAQAADLVNARPIADVMNAIKDESNGLQFHIRSTMGQIVIQRLNETAARLKAAGDTEGAKVATWQAIDMSEHAMELGTRLGQGVQSFAQWNRLTPEGKLMSTMRLVRKVRQDFTKRNGDDVSKVVEGVNEGLESDAKPDKINKLVERKLNQIAEQLSDTPSFKKQTPVRQNEVLALIRAHLKERQGSFKEKMDSLGVARQWTDRVDLLATENRRRIEAIENSKAVQARAKEFDAAADRIADQLSDTPSFRSRGQPDLAKQLIKDHLKSPQKDFVNRLVNYGADVGTAHTIDRLAVENRERILTADRAQRANELRKAYTPKNKVAKKLGKSEWEKLVELADHGLLTDKSFMDTASAKLGLPRITPEVQNKILELAGKIRDATGGTPQDLARRDLAHYVKSVMGYKIQDIPSGIYYANMLSGYNTHLVNLVDTAFNVFAEVNNLALANPRSAARLWAGAAKGLGEGTADFWLALSAGRQITNSKWLEADDIMEVARFGERGGVPPIKPGTRSGRAMHWLAESKAAYPLRLAKYVGRLMSASDALMYRTAREAKASLIADRAGRELKLTGKELDNYVQEALGRTSDLEKAWYEQATKEGFTGAARRVRAMELRSQVRGIDANADAHEFAGATTYNHQPRGWLGHFSNAVDRTFAPLPFGRAVIIPFTKIVANVTNRKLDYFPVVGHMRAIRGYYGDEGTPKADERAALMARANIGTMALVGLGAAQYAGLIQIHGSGPSDTQKRKQKIETGWRPYTFELGGHYYSYMMSPPGLLIAALGNMIDTFRYDDLNKQDVLTRSTYVASQIPVTVFNQTFLSSLSNLFDAMSQTDPERSIFAMKKFASSTLGTFTTPRIALDVQRIFDPKMYRGDTIQGVLLQNTPFSSLVNRPVLNAFGEPVKPPSNRFVSTVTKDLAWQTLVQAQLTVPTPSKSTKMPDGKGGQRDITPAEYYELVKRSGPEIRKWVIDNSPLLISLSKETANPKFQQGAQDGLSTAAEAARKRVLFDLYQHAMTHPID